MALDPLLTRIRSCTLCSATLEPRPVLRVAPQSRVLIIGQAPGSKVHASGIPWDDASGDHLIEWLGVDRRSFEDPRRFGIVPMGFCYPGKGKSGDLKPPPICAATWHAPLLAELGEASLVLLLGQYAQKHYLGAQRSKTLTETVRRFAELGPRVLPLPHPAWRSKIWMAKHPWFAAEVLPELRRRVAEATADLPVLRPPG